MRKILQFFLLLVLFFFLSIQVISSQNNQKLDSTSQSGSIEILVRGFRSNDGQLLISLFDGPDGFPSEYTKAAQTATADISDLKASLILETVPSGIYAIALLHDENGNEKLDTGLFGIPSEGYGASNDARGFLGPPSFEDAAFELTEEGISFTMKLSY